MRRATGRCHHLIPLKSDFRGRTRRSRPCVFALGTAYQYRKRDHDFEWDDRKAKRNERLHGVTFELARLVFDDPNAIDRLDLDEADEDRELITGLVGDVLLTVCFVERGQRKRIISVRKATHREQIDYTEANTPSRNGN